jgi:hypothetical protein
MSALTKAELQKALEEAQRVEAEAIAKLKKLEPRYKRMQRSVALKTSATARAARLVAIRDYLDEVRALSQDARTLLQVIGYFQPAGGFNVLTVGAACAELLAAGLIDNSPRLGTTERGNRCLEAIEEWGASDVAATN